MTNISLLFETIFGLSGCGVSNVIYMLFSFLLFRCLKRCFYSHLHAVSNVLFSSVLEWRRVFIRNVFFLVWCCCRAILQLVENRWWIEGWQRRICPVCHSKRQNVRSKAVRSIRTERDMPERFRRRLKRGFRADANALLEAAADEGRRRVAPVKRHVPNVYFQFLHLALFCPYEAQKGENCWSLNGLCVAALWPNYCRFRRILYF